ncbi:18596_t:CDS:2 [Funneliformis geosporum]|uniref:19393_t:CDS:1 n=1 Tax=Funneliformis geosporum TaxID=1117311 RepID=A0A9W4SN46_9GLOM|nr:18596_t:CDS:2 [Funneliformis geosporum]CAI2175355.1 19393_t:CDS:2 [Funneliformis geosporum]
MIRRRIQRANRFNRVIRRRHLQRLARPFDNTETLYRIVALPPQVIDNDPLVDEFFNDAVIQEIDLNSTAELAEIQI